MGGNVVALRKAAPDDRATVKRALYWLRKDLVRERGGAEPTDAEMIEAAIRLCVKVDRDAASAGPSGHKNSWPAYGFTEEELKEAEKQFMIDLTAGDVIERAKPVTDNDVDAADAIERVFYAALVGKEPKRDWRILFLLAQKRRHDGLGAQTEQTGSVRAVARQIETWINSKTGDATFTPRAVRKVRDKQLAAIAAGIADLLPQPEYRTGIIWQAAA